MAGVKIPILRKTSYDLSNLGNAGKSIVLLEPYINTMAYREASLVLRMHTTPTWSAGAKIEADLLWTDQCPDDPGIFFNYPGVNSIAVIINQNDNPAPTAGYMKTGTVTGGLLETMGVGLTFQQSTTAASYLVTVSIDLFLKY